jgi:hypothetical protein
VFWANRGASILVGKLKARLNTVFQNDSDRAQTFGQYYFAVEPGDTAKANWVLENSACLNNEKYGTLPPNFHAAPVFNWSAWSSYPVGNDAKGWEKRGIEFRRQMKLHGCGNSAWFVNELPRAWRAENKEGESSAQGTLRRAKMRARIVGLLKGLYHGGDGQADAPGFTADVVNPQDKDMYHGLGDLKASLKRAYSHDKFWEAVNEYTIGWSKEVYNNCSLVCVPRQSGWTQSEWLTNIADNGVNNYSFHQRLLANKAPYDAVKSALSDHYMPLLNGAWNSSDYNTQFSSTRMARLIRLQIYSVRRAQHTAYSSASKIGFAWKEAGFKTGDIDNEETIATQLAVNLAQSLISAYKNDSDPNAACKDSGGNDLCTWTQQVPGLNHGWDIFKNWN